MQELRYGWVWPPQPRSEVFGRDVQCFGSLTLQKLAAMAMDANSLGSYYRAPDFTSARACPLHSLGYSYLYLIFSSGKYTITSFFAKWIWLASRACREPAWRVKEQSSRIYLNSKHVHEKLPAQVASDQKYNVALYAFGRNRSSIFSTDNSTNDRNAVGKACDMRECSRCSV